MVFGMGSPVMVEAYSAEVAEFLAVRETGSARPVTVLRVDIDGDIVLP